MSPDAAERPGINSYRSDRDLNTPQVGCHVITFSSSRIPHCIIFCTVERFLCGKRKRVLRTCGSCPRIARGLCRCPECSWPSWPHACIFPLFFDEYWTPVVSSIGSASISAAEGGRHRRCLYPFHSAVAVDPVLPCLYLKRNHFNAGFLKFCTVSCCLRCESSSRVFTPDRASTTKFFTSSAMLPYLFLHFPTSSYNQLAVEKVMKGGAAYTCV